MPLSIKRNGNRPQSVGGLVVPWKVYDAAPENTKAFVRQVSYAPELLEFAGAVARSACLRQVNQGTCICFSCEAKRLLIAANAVLP